MVKDDLISVIVPVYKVEKYLDRCVESIVNQTYKNLEIILVDDGSPDNCSQMCDEWAKRDSRIKVIHKANGGQADARNAGLDIAIGDYITFVDSDDVVDKDYVEYLWNIKCGLNVDVAICQDRLMHSDGELLCDNTFHEREFVLNGHDACKNFLYQRFIQVSSWAKIYKKSIFDGLRFPKGKIFEDTYMTGRILCCVDNIGIGTAAKYNYYINDGSTMTKPFSAAKLDLIGITDEIVDDMLSKFPDLAQAGLRRKVYARLSTLNQMRDVDGYFDERQKIIEYVLLNGRSVLKDKMAPKMDKVAILCLYVGYWFYRFAWKAYCWVKK